MTRYLYFQLNPAVSGRKEVVHPHNDNFIFNKVQRLLLSHHYGPSPAHGGAKHLPYSYNLRRWRCSNSHDFLFIEPVLKVNKFEKEKVVWREPPPLFSDCAVAKTGQYSCTRILFMSMIHFAVGAVDPLLLFTEKK